MLGGDQQEHYRLDTAYRAFIWYVVVVLCCYWSLFCWVNSAEGFSDLELVVEVEVAAKGAIKGWGWGSGEGT